MVKTILFYFLFFTGVLYAQEPVSIHLSEKDGLPDKEFYNLIEDSKGFIWLCADKGLFRYDGKQYKSYSNKKQRGLSVFGVKEDSKGRIWCNNIGGQFFYVQDDVFHTFLDLGNLLNGELAEFELYNNALFVFTFSKVFKIDIVTKTISVVCKSNTISSPFKKNERLIFSNADSVFTIDFENKLKLIASENYDDQTNKIKKTNFFNIKNQLFYWQFYNSENKFFEIDEATQKIKKKYDFKAINKTLIYSIFTIDNQLWLTTSSGVWVYSYINNNFILEKHFLKEKDVSKCIKDKDSNFWFSTLNNGVYVVPNIYIENYTISESNKNISCLEKIAKNTLIYGLNNGKAIIYNTTTNTEKIIEFSNKSRISSIKYNPVTHQCYISRDTEGFLLDIKNLSIKKNNNLGTIKAIAIKNSTELILVNYNSTRIKNTDSLSSRFFKKISSERGYTTYYSSKSQTVYVGSVSELLAFDDLWNETKIRDGNNPINAISITETNNAVWVATFKNGIFQIKNNKIINHITVENGLISNRIQKIKADNDENKLWIATDKGIQHYDIEALQFKTLIKSDGLISNDITGIEIMNNKVVFSSPKGLFGIHKQHAFKKLKLPKVYFTSIEINEAAMPLASRYSLNYNQNAIKIDFNANGFQFNSKGKYKYRLKGFNDNWLINEAFNNSIKYNSLPEGHYVFQVQPLLENSISEKAEQIEEIVFVINKPFWERWWFISALVCLVLGTIILYYRIKIEKEEQQREIEVKQLSLDNELITLKLENLRSQMNPHFVFNALNSIQDYIVNNKKGLAGDYLGKFANLIRMYLNQSNEKEILLTEEIETLERYLELEKLRFEDKLEYSINAAIAQDINEIIIPTMLIQPYVENALKHGLLHKKEKGHLNITFSLNDNASFLFIYIIDDGVGRKKAEEIKRKQLKNHNSFATRATENRLELLNFKRKEKILIHTKDTNANAEDGNVGTTVVIKIPINRTL